MKRFIKVGCKLLASAAEALKLWWYLLTHNDEAIIKHCYSGYVIRNGVKVELTLDEVKKIMQESSDMFGLLDGDLMAPKEISEAMARAEATMARAEAAFNKRHEGKFK